MGSVIDQRHKVVEMALMQRPDAVVGVTIELWERLAVELVSIIGEDGFDSLYARSGYLTRACFPWLLLDHAVQSTGSRFAGLRISLESRELTEAGEASRALLITFVDILALLVGDLLTASILRSAWVDDTLATAVKELKNA